MQATTKAPRQQRKLPAVRGVCRWICRPEANPHVQGVGLLEINGERYAVTRDEDGLALMAAEKDRDGNTRLHHLPADLSSCDCGDFTFRSHLREDGRCKHQKAAMALGLGR